MRNVCQYFNPIPTLLPHIRLLFYFLDFSGVSALLSMLVVCNIGNAVKHGSSALTLADTYILYCFLFVLGSLIATICQSLCCNCSRNDNQNKENDGDSNFVFSQTKNFKKSSICDKIVGTVFPAVFVLLLVIYYIFGFN